MAKPPPLESIFCSNFRPKFHNVHAFLGGQILDDIPGFYRMGTARSKNKYLWKASQVRDGSK
jgi:hypothetical protein